MINGAGYTRVHPREAEPTRVNGVDGGGVVDRSGSGSTAAPAPAARVRVAASAPAVTRTAGPRAAAASSGGSGGRADGSTSSPWRRSVGSKVSPQAEQTMTGPLPIGADAPDFERRHHRRPASSSTSGLAARGASSSRTPRISPRSARPSWATWRSIKPDFDKRGVKVIGLSVDPVDKHAGWSKDIAETQGTAPNYPDDRGLRPEGRQALWHAAGRRRRVVRRPHRGRQRDRAQRLRDRPRQEDQAGALLPDEHGPQLRRGAPHASIRSS